MGKKQETKYVRKPNIQKVARNSHDDWFTQYVSTYDRNVHENKMTTSMYVCVCGRAFMTFYDSAHGACGK